MDKKVEVEINLKKWSRCFHELKVNETVHPSFETEEVVNVPFFPFEISATGIPL